MWDATCPDTFVPSRLASATSGVGAVSALAKQNKLAKYLPLDQCHTFVPVASETAGPFGPETLLFLRKLGCHLKQVTGKPSRSVDVSAWSIEFRHCMVYALARFALVTYLSQIINYPPPLVVPPFPSFFFPCTTVALHLLSFSFAVYQGPPV